MFGWIEVKEPTSLGEIKLALPIIKAQLHVEKKSEQGSSHETYANFET